jgi:uncharacterized phage protein (TIGR02216 family)
LNDARPQPFPWGAALHFGLGRLRLVPAHFWAMSPRELIAMTGGMRPAEAPTRDQLTALMDEWPDKEILWNPMS